jgi:3-oxoacyl-[acyl-carrier-protein] synthase-3
VEHNARSTSRRAQVIGTGSYLPAPAITNAALAQFAGALPEDILAGIQVTQRHWVIDTATGEHRENNSGMAVKAIQNALAQCNLSPGEIDLLVCSTSSPEYLLPPMITFVQEQLGIEKCATLEIRSGCAGTVEALDVARLYLESGIHRTAVVVGSETISPLLAPIFLGKSPDAIRMRERMNLYNFGDGAGAIVLRAVESAPDGCGIRGGALASVGGNKAPAMQIIGAGTHAPIHQQLKARRLVELKVDVVESGRFTPYVLTEALREVLRGSDTCVEEIDVCIIPEGNAGYMTDELREAGLLTPEWLAMEGKIVENLALVGATGSAAVPLALDDAVRKGKVKPGDRVMLLAIETSKWKYAGIVLDWTIGTEA